MQVKVQRMRNVCPRVLQSICTGMAGWDGPGKERKKIPACTCEALGVPSTLEMSLRQRFENLGQSHIFEGYDSLPDDSQRSFMDYLTKIDMDHLERIYRISTSQLKAADTAITPPPAKSLIRPLSTPMELPQLWKTGLGMISRGEVCLLLLAGGQGTRLGYPKPKGTYTFASLPSQPSLFRVQADRVMKLQTLADKASLSTGSLIHWCIMTSEATDKDTKEFFALKDFFGLRPDQVHFFQQGHLPCVAETPDDGEEEGCDSMELPFKLLLASPGKLCTAPNGNGACYEALHASGLMKEMKDWGVKYIHMYCVDNILVKVCDPVLMAVCSERGLDLASKVIPKRHPHERVGVFGVKKDGFHVVEYSEISKDMAEATKEGSEELLFNESNIVNFVFSVDFLEKCTKKKYELYHVAKKDIPTLQGPRPGMKFELFNFDVCCLADVDKVGLVMGKREEDFSPLKNAPGSERGCTAATCVADMSSLCRSWICLAGGTVLDGPEGQKECYVSPLVSYAGEGLEKVKGQTFSCPVLIVPE